ncbi:MAG: two pore domain potassium channel family protein [Eggerthellaceae bacterium]|nr:two pore domain potassium channel family protein [Eggerthellaceae bacterium]
MDDVKIAQDYEWLKEDPGSEPLASRLRDSIENNDIRLIDPNSMKLHALLPVIRAAGLVNWTVAFVALFIVCAAVVAIIEPGMDAGDAIWFMFQIVSTIGLGDYACTTFMGRVATIVLSMYSVLFFALVTGAMVSFCNERMRFRRDKSVAHFIYQLEHLPELSPQELEELSRKIKRI